MEGINRGYIVVPEFHVPIKYAPRPKKLDLAWLKSRTCQNHPGPLSQWRLCAAFEIEGLNVARRRIQEHAKAFSHLHSTVNEYFPCYIALYEEAFHRTDLDWHPRNPDRYLADRQEIARLAGGVVSVLRGSDLAWVKTIRAI